jgi:UDP-N-acetylglucosamine acyltransferase
MRIHPTAVIEPGAELHDDVEVGPYAVIGRGVSVGRGTRILAHAVLEGPTRIGEENVIHSFAVVGGAPQAKKEGEAGRLIMGDKNTVREHATIHRGTQGNVTHVGSSNLLMVGCHVAHDVTIGSHVTLSNAVQLAGHAVIEDYVTFGGMSGVAQFVKVGESAFVAAGAMCERVVPPFVVVQGDRARVRALNKVGLRRRGIDEAAIARLERAFRLLFGSKLTRAEALRALDQSDALVRKLATALGL